MRLGGHARMETSDGTEWDWDRIWKIRARHLLRNEQGNNYVSGLYRLSPTVRRTGGPQKSGSHPPVPPRIPTEYSIAPRLV